MSATRWEVLDKTGFEFSGSDGSVSGYKLQLSLDWGIPWGIKWTDTTYLSLGACSKWAWRFGKDYEKTSFHQVMGLASINNIISSNFMLTIKVCLIQVEFNCSMVTDMWCIVTVIITFAFDFRTRTYRSTHRVFARGWNSRLIASGYVVQVCECHGIHQ